MKFSLCGSGSTALTTGGTSTYMLSVGGDAGLVAGPTLAGGLARHLPLRVALALP